MNSPVFPLVAFSVCVAGLGWSVPVTTDAENARAAMAEQLQAQHEEITRLNFANAELKKQSTADTLSLTRRVVVLEKVLERDGGLIHDNELRISSAFTRLTVLVDTYAGTEEESYGKKRAIHWARIKTSEDQRPDPERLVDIYFATALKMRAEKK